MILGTPIIQHNASTANDLQISTICPKLDSLWNSYILAIDKEKSSSFAAFIREVTALQQKAFCTLVYFYKANIHS